MQPPKGIFPKQILMQNRPDWISALFALQQTDAWRSTRQSLSLTFADKQDMKAAFQQFKGKFKEKVAAGGLVKNEDQALLGIQCRGYWTFPKGHLEKKEGPKATAVREVQEETGLKTVIRGKKIGTAYHTFSKNDTPIFKTTHWYHMIGPSHEPLIPQTEEGITDARWLTQAQWQKRSQDLYASDLQLLHQISFL
ncbi:MAG: NUDIX domain-containing protein [Bacteroidota bacterium]